MDFFSRVDIVKVLAVRELVALLENTPPLFPNSERPLTLNPNMLANVKTLAGFDETYPHAEELHRFRPEILTSY